MNKTLPTILFLLGVMILPVAAQAQDVAPAVSNAPTLLMTATDIAQNAELARDVADMTQLTGGDKRRVKPTVRTLLRYPGREWTRLLLRYTQPVVRGLIADQRGNSGSLSLKTTLFRNNAKGMKLVGGIGRDASGTREARLQFSARF